MRKIKENLFWTGVIDWDRRVFDSLIPLPDGTSYNAYLLKGSEKTVLFDTVDAEHIEEILVKLQSEEKIDYIVSHHAEQDHSGAIPAVLEKYPAARLIVSPKAKGLLKDILQIEDDRFWVVEDGQTLSLGDKTLKFMHMPWVHWPETMVTYLEEDHILFSCDLFGSHLATSDLFAEDKSRVYEAAKRYYAEIMMPFRSHIEKHLERLAGLELKMIAPSHGPVHNDPDFILRAYRDWVLGKPKNGVSVFYISMHGSTREMVNHFIQELIKRDVKVERFELTYPNIGKMAMSLVDAATIVVATPTVIGGPHPNVAYAAYLANLLNPKAKFIGLIGSLGWGGRVAEQVTKMVSNIKAEVLPPVLTKGFPHEQDYEALANLAETIAQKHRELLAEAF